MAQARGQWIEQQEAADAAFVQQMLAAQQAAEQKRRAEEAKARQQAWQSYRAGERESYSATPPACTPENIQQSKSWWQRAWEGVKRTVDNGLHWIDQHQPATALAVGVGVGLAAAAIVLTGGLAAPLAIGLAAGVAGLTVGAGTVGLNAYFQRPLTTNLLKNTVYAAGAAVATSLVVIGGGLLVQSGVVQQGLYTVGNAATRLCITYPAACARVGAVMTLWDKVEDIGLQAKLALQTAQRDPRAADTALELQLERLDNTPGNTTFREVQEALSTLVGKYGDEVASLVKRFGNEGAELLAKRQDDAVEFFTKHADEAEDVSRYVHHVVDVDLANLNLEQGYVVSELAQELGIPITITGRWADTPAEAARRAQAVERMKDLVSQGMDENLARLQAASEFGINPQQVKISGGGPEVDVFIPRDIWDNLAPDQQVEIRQRLIQTFNVENRPDFAVDFYQELPLDKVAIGWPDPRTNVPPGSISFHSDGTIIHSPFATP